MFITPMPATDQLNPDVARRSGAEAIPQNRPLTLQSQLISFLFPFCPSGASEKGGCPDAQPLKWLPVANKSLRDFGSSKLEGRCPDTSRRDGTMTGRQFIACNDGNKLPRTSRRDRMKR